MQTDSKKHDTPNDANNVLADSAISDALSTILRVGVSMVTTIKSITHHTVVLSHTPEGFTEPWDYSVDITPRGEINWAPGNAFLRSEMTVAELQYLEECVERLSDTVLF